MVHLLSKEKGILHISFAWWFNYTTILYYWAHKLTAIEVLCAKPFSIADCVLLRRKSVMLWDSSKHFWCGSVRLPPYNSGRSAAPALVRRWPHFQLVIPSASYFHLSRSISLSLDHGKLIIVFVHSHERWNRVGRGPKRGLSGNKAYLTLSTVCTCRINHQNYTTDCEIYWVILR